MTAGLESDSTSLRWDLDSDIYEKPTRFFFFFEMGLTMLLRLSSNT
jgi:hypothetical protein